MELKTIGQAARISALLVASLLGASLLCAGARAQNPPLGNTTSTKPSPEHALLGEMVGTWDVLSRIWTGPDAKPITLPLAVAKRRLIGGTLLEEIMTPAPETDQESFTRVAYLNYNDTTRRYEWSSWDSRAPQMMYETSYAGSDPGLGQEQDRRVISLYLGGFVLPQWGKATNAAFKQRRIVEIERNRQVTRQYWTPISGQSAEEFLAVEYVYTRQQ